MLPGLMRCSASAPCKRSVGQCISTVVSAVRNDCRGRRLLKRVARGLVCSSAARPEAVQCFSTLRMKGVGRVQTVKAAEEGTMDWPTALPANCCTML